MFSRSLALALYLWYIEMFLFWRCCVCCRASSFPPSSAGSQKPFCADRRRCDVGDERSRHRGHLQPIPRGRCVRHETPRGKHIPCVGGARVEELPRDSLSAVPTVSSVRNTSTETQKVHVVLGILYRKVEDRNKRRTRQLWCCIDVYQPSSKKSVPRAER